MKTCSTCKVEKSLDQFHRNSTKPDGFQYSCKACKSAYNKTHQQRYGKKFAASRTASKLEARKRAEEFLEQYLGTHPCVDCGESDIIVLEFDHLRDKKFEIGLGRSNGYSVAALASEIKKCDVVCCNCHRRRTFSRLGGTWRHHAPVF